MTDTEYWRILKEIGWLDYIEESNVAEVREQLKKNLKRGVKGAHLALAQFEFEPGEQSLSELLEMLEDESRGRFKPVDVKETEDRLSFKVGKDRYTCEIDDDAEFQVIELVNQSLRKKENAPQFIQLPGGDSYVPVVFVPLAVFQKAVDAKLFGGSKAKSAEKTGTFQFVIAASDDAGKAVLARFKSKRWPDLVSMPDVHQSSLADLLTLLQTGAKPVDAVIERSDLVPGMFELTPAGIAAVRKLTSNKVGGVVKKWIKASLPHAKADELALEMLSDAVWDLCNLAKRAKGPNERVIGQFRP